jgi:hypothetical protein
MTLETIRGVVAWCALINLGLLLWWFLFLTLGHDWTYRLHTKWFKLSVDQFDAIHYAGLALFKIGHFGVYRGAVFCSTYHRMSLRNPASISTTGTTRIPEFTPPLSPPPRNNRYSLSHSGSPDISRSRIQAHVLPFLCSRAEP